MKRPLAAKLGATMLIGALIGACQTHAPPRRYPDPPAQRPVARPLVATRPPVAKPPPARSPVAVARPAVKPKPSPAKPIAPPIDPPLPEEERDGPPDPKDIPPWLTTQPDPQPREEPDSATGNRPEYEVFGSTYKVMNRPKVFREVGLASWYGKKFHGRKTSSGEPYDMFRLTAAHKHLPLPTFVRVTNLSNDKSIVVRINDRGPFKDGRIIDLSYAAAAKLGMLGKLAMVEIETLTAQTGKQPAPHLMKAVGRPRLLQVAAFSDPRNAAAMRTELEEQGFAGVLIRDGRLSNGDQIHRVVLGPFDGRQKMDEARIRARGAGYEAFAVSE